MTEEGGKDLRGGWGWRRNALEKNRTGTVAGDLFFELELIPCAAGNDLSLQPDENLPALPPFQPVPEPTREPAHRGSFLCSMSRETSPFRMNPALRSLEDRIGGDKKTAYPIELSKNFGIVEKNIFGRSFAGRQSPGRAVMAGVELCFCTVCGYAVSHLLKWPEKYPFYRLLFPWGLCIFAAMFKASVIILGIIWASLLLISWGGAENPPKQAPAVAQVRPGF